MKHNIRLIVDSKESSKIYSLEEAKTEFVCEECHLRWLCEEGGATREAVTTLCLNIGIKRKCWKQTGWIYGKHQ